jgi:hypothetical protein
MDIGWGMDKTQGMTWTTFPRANFGLFLVKGTELSAKVTHLSSPFLIPTLSAVPPIMGEVSEQ